VALTETLHEDFSAALDTGKWTEVDSASSMAVSGGVLAVNLNTAYASITSVDAFDLEGSYVTVRFPTMHTGGTGMEAALIVESTTTPADNKLTIMFTSWVICRHSVAGVDQTLDVDDSGPRGTNTHLRIREAAGVIYFEASADGESWTVFGEDHERAWSINSVRVKLEAGNWSTSTGTCSFDDLNPVTDAVTVTAAAAEIVTSGTTVQPDPPAHAADTILLAEGGYLGASDLSVAGWEAVGVQNAANLSTGWWWKRAASGAETAPTITSSATASGSAPLWGRCHAIEGVDPDADPFADATFAGSPTDSTTPTGSAIDTPTDAALALCFAQIAEVGGYASGLPPSGWSTVADEAIS
jgi:hypothetical protein